MAQNLNLTLASLMGFTLLAWLSWLGARTGQQHKTLRNRLEQLVTPAKPESVVEQELKQPFRERIVGPLIRATAGLMGKILPVSRRENLHRKLQAAGVKIPSETFAALEYFLPILVGGATFSLTWLKGQPVYLSLTWSAILGLGAMRLPQLFLRWRARQRQHTIARELPGLLDLLTVSVEAGMGLDAAMAKVAAQSKGQLAQELGFTINLIRMGKTRREALKDLAERVNQEDLGNLVTAIVQAEQLGSSIGQVLRIQSGQVRQKRRQMVEEQAMKAPIKMLIPLVLFIFPAIFIVLLGPALLRFREFFH